VVQGSLAAAAGAAVHSPATLAARSVATNRALGRRRDAFMGGYLPPRR